MAEHSLSKSTYIRGLQCNKSLYLHKFRPYLRDKLSEEQLAKFARGHVVGKVAQQLFPGGTTLARPSKTTAEKTQKLIEEGVKVIYEACFMYQDVIVAIDILVKKDSMWEAYEVKSSYSLSETYYNDAALQYNIICGSGLQLNSFSLVYRNPEMEIPVDEFKADGFLFTDVTDFCVKKSEDVIDKINYFKDILLLTNSPDIQPGEHCMKPYPCDFRGVCWKKLTDEQRNELLNQTL